MVAVASLGLGGDGDEVEAIEAAFAALGIAIPLKDAPGWVTVGDVWASAVRVKPAVAKTSGAWDEFRTAICSQSAVDVGKVDPDTKLLAEPYGLKDLAQDMWRRARG